MYQTLSVFSLRSLSVHLLTTHPSQSQNGTPADQGTGDMLLSTDKFLASKYSD